MVAPLWIYTLNMVNRPTGERGTIDHQQRPQNRRTKWRSTHVIYIVRPSGSFSVKKGTRNTDGSFVIFRYSVNTATHVTSAAKRALREPLVGDARDSDPRCARGQDKARRPS
jgi:hypothetical protein